MNTPSSFSRFWQLDPDVALLNHGSFGATPTVVLESQRRFRDALEHEPIRFLAAERELAPKLDTVRQRIASLVNAVPSDIGFVRNATDGVNAVLRSFPFKNGDEIVVTDHGYNACSNAARFVAERSGASVHVAKLPFPVADDDEIVAAVTAAFSDRTRLLLVDHVTSSTALILPIIAIVDAARKRGIRTLVDGAHAPGMVPVDLARIDPDYYTANHHKWLCGPKASGFLYVRPELQPQVRPTVISHGANTPRPGRSRFLAEFDWVGTYDPTPLLATCDAIDFVQSLHPDGLPQYRQCNHQLAVRGRSELLETLQIPAPTPEAMIGSMASIELPGHFDPTTEPVDSLQSRLFNDYRIEVPVFRGPAGKRMLRISAQAYNHVDQYRRLAEALRVELKRERKMMKEGD